MKYCNIIFIGVGNMVCVIIVGLVVGGYFVKMISVCVFLVKNCDVFVVEFGVISSDDNIVEVKIVEVIVLVVKL